MTDYMFFSYYYVIWIFHIVYTDSMVSMTAVFSAVLKKQQLCAYIDVNPLSHSRDHNVQQQKRAW